MAERDGRRLSGMGTSSNSHPDLPATGSPSASDLLTSIPGLLGFIPDRSLVIVACADDGTVMVGVRNDLAWAADGPAAEVHRMILADVAEVVARHEAGSVIAVVVDDRCDPDDLPVAALMAMVDEAFASTGGLYAGFVLREMNQGASWQTVWWPALDVERMCVRGLRESGITQIPVQIPESGAGHIGDPTSSPTALRRALSSGRVVLATRAEITSMLDPRWCECEVCTGTIHPAESLSATSPTTADRMAMMLGLLGARDELSCTSVGEAGRALRDRKVRDVLLVLSVTGLRVDAERLWRQLTCRLRGADRASAATLLAHLHYVAGEGTYAAMALETALRADPSASMARLLERALSVGAPPSLLRESLGYAYDLAHEHGILLPPRTLWVEAAG